MTEATPAPRPLRELAAEAVAEETAKRQADRERTEDKDKDKDNLKLYLARALHIEINTNTIRMVQDPNARYPRTYPEVDVTDLTFSLRPRTHAHSFDAGLHVKRDWGWEPFTTLLQLGEALAKEDPRDLPQVAPYVSCYDLAREKVDELGELTAGDLGRGETLGLALVYAVLSVAESQGAHPGQ